MNAPDLTIAIFAGRSAAAAHATLAAVDRALRPLREGGACEAEILLLPDEDTPDLRGNVAGIAGRDDLRLLDACPRAAARQAAVAAARGTVLAFIDAGDLWSGNFLRAAMAAARRESDRHAVWRPEAVIECGLDYFDFDHRATLQQPMADADMGATLLHACPYAPTFLAHRAVFAHAPFPTADAARGWLDVDAWWIAQCLGAGHAQRILDGTLVYRWAPAERLARPVRIGPSPLFAGAADHAPR